MDGRSSAPSGVAPIAPGAVLRLSPNPDWSIHAGVDQRVPNRFQCLAGLLVHQQGGPASSRGAEDVVAHSFPGLGDLGEAPAGDFHSRNSGTAIEGGMVPSAAMSGAGRQYTEYASTPISPNF